jgi:ribosome biogenesis GTPase
MQHSSTATVIASYGQRGVLQAENVQLPYLLKGRKLRAVCGDRVRWIPSDNRGQAVVTAVLDRSNVLERPDNRGGSEPLAANLNTLAVVIAPEPEPDFFIADRFICAAELMKARCLIVWNKNDLQSDASAELDEYRQLSYEVVSTSATAGAGITELQRSLDTGISMLVGQSGVGKSSLINQLVDDANVLTGQLSDVSREGRHTTTASVAHALGGGGLLVDSPGIRDFVPTIDDVSKIQLGYTEIVGRADQCRFADCEHTR